MVIAFDISAGVTDCGKVHLSNTIPDVVVGGFTSGILSAHCYRPSPSVSSSSAAPSFLLLFLSTLIITANFNTSVKLPPKRLRPDANIDASVILSYRSHLSFGPRGSQSHICAPLWLFRPVAVFASIPPSVRKTAINETLDAFVRAGTSLTDIGWSMEIRFGPGPLPLAYICMSLLKA